VIFISALSKPPGQHGNMEEINEERFPPHRH